jgi:hypothetical protein
MSIKTNYCINKDAFNIITAVMNTVSDFLVYLWPIQFLWNMRLPVKHRIGVIVMFAIGCRSVFPSPISLLYGHVLTDCAVHA